MTLYLETVIMLSGDDADETFKILFARPGHYTTAESLTATLEHLQAWDYGEACELWRLPRLHGDYARFDGYLMRWSWDHQWIALDRIISDDTLINDQDVELLKDLEERIES